VGREGMAWGTVPVICLLLVVTSNEICTHKAYKLHRVMLGSICLTLCVE
jgi:hypothetical protein